MRASHTLVRPPTPARGALRRPSLRWNTRLRLQCSLRCRAPASARVRALSPARSRALAAEAPPAAPSPAPVPTPRRPARPRAALRRAASRPHPRGSAPPCSPQSPPRGAWPRAARRGAARPRRRARRGAARRCRRRTASRPRGGAAAAAECTLCFISLATTTHHLRLRSPSSLAADAKRSNATPRPGGALRPILGFGVCLVRWSRHWDRSALPFTAGVQSPTPASVRPGCRPRQRLPSTLLLTTPCFAAHLRAPRRGACACSARAARVSLTRQRPSEAEGARAVATVGCRHTRAPAVRGAGACLLQKRGARHGCHRAALRPPRRGCARGPSQSIASHTCRGRRRRGAVEPRAAGERSLAATRRLWPEPGTYLS